MANESVSKTFTVALTLCIVCAVVVSSAAVFLRPAQEANKLLDLKTNILASAGLLEEGVDVETQFEKISVKLVDMDTGRYTDAIDPANYDQRKASADPALSVALGADDDIAKIKRRANYSKVYVVENELGLEKVILPIKGYGLWSTLYGFIALESDLKTVAGIGFYGTQKRQVLVVRWTIPNGNLAGLVSRPTVVIPMCLKLSKVKLTLTAVVQNQKLMALLAQP